MDNDQLFKQLAIDCGKICGNLDYIAQDIISWLAVENVLEANLVSLRVVIEPSHSPIDKIFSIPMVAVLKYLELPSISSRIYTIESDYLLIKYDDVFITFERDSMYFNIKRRGGKYNTRKIHNSIYSVDFLKIINLYFQLFSNLSQLRKPLTDQIMVLVKEFFTDVRRVCEGKEVSDVK